MGMMRWMPTIPCSVFMRSPNHCAEAVVQSPTTQYSSSSASIVVVVVFVDTDDGVSVEIFCCFCGNCLHQPTLIIVQVERDINEHQT